MRGFALNLSLFLDGVPFEDRPARAAALGFTTVECWWPFHQAAPDDAEAERLARRFRQAGVTLAALNFYAGDMANGDRGIAAHPGATGKFRASVDAAMAFAQAVGGCDVYNALYGNRLPDVPEKVQDEAACENLAYASVEAGKRGAVVVVEALNHFENPHYPLTRTADVVQLIHRVRTTTGQQIAYLYDCYHMQRMEGNLIATIHEHHDLIGHVQIADSPGRNEPGTGEINYARVIEALETVGYEGWVGLEYRPSNDISSSIAWLRELPLR